MVGHQPANFGDNRYCGKIDAFSLSSDFARSCDQLVM